MENNDKQNSMPRVLVEMRALSYQLLRQQLLIFDLGKTNEMQLTN